MQNQDAQLQIVVSTVWIKYFTQPVHDKMHCKTQLQAQCACSNSSTLCKTRCTTQRPISACQDQIPCKNGSKRQVKKHSYPFKIVPNVPKRHQNWLQERSGGPKLKPRGQSWPQDAPKRPQIEAKRRPRPPKWRPRGTKWAPSWVQEVAKRGQEESKEGLRAPKMQSKSTSKMKKHTLRKI